MTHTSIRSLALCLCATLAAACGTGQKAAEGPKGKVNFSFKSQTHASTSAVIPANGICADWTLQPVAIDDSGNQTIAGSAVTINQTSNSSATQTILGCIDSPTAHPDWGYIVTATNFYACGDTTKAPIAGLTPTIQTQTVTIDCDASHDIPLALTANVSIPADSNAGYVDISVSVNAHEVSVGCKLADQQGDGLHFGESNIGPTKPLGLVGMDYTTAPTQFEGVVNVPASTDVDTFYTGIANPAGLGVLLQTFLDPVANAQLYPGAPTVNGAPAPAAQVCADNEHPQCITMPCSNATTRCVGNTWDTAPSLADLFLTTAKGFASFNVSNPTTLQIYTSGTMDTESVANLPTTDLGANLGMFSQSLVVGSASATITGVWANQSTTAGAAVVTLSDNTYELLGFDATTHLWGVVSGPSNLTDLSSTQQSCMGIFGSASNSCFNKKDCPAAKVSCEQDYSQYNASEIQKLCPGSRLLGAVGEYCSAYQYCKNEYTKYLEGYLAAHQNSCTGAAGIAHCSVTSNPATGGHSCTCN